MFNHGGRVQFTIVVSRTPNRASECLLQVLAPTNQRITILGFDMAILGADPATVPHSFDFTVQSDAGVAGAGATVVTPQKAYRGDNETIQGTFTRYDGAGPTDPTPTADSVIWKGALHRQGTLLWRPPSNFKPIIVMGGERVGMRHLDASFTAQVITLYMEQ